MKSRIHVHSQQGDVKIREGRGSGYWNTQTMHCCYIKNSILIKFLYK
jgi:hypothetical protein